MVLIDTSLNKVKNPKPRRAKKNQGKGSRRPLYLRRRKIAKTLAIVEYLCFILTI